MTVLEYRKKHKRCRYCKYLKIIESPSWMNIIDCHDLWKCEAKDKFLKCYSFPLRGCFCKVFEAKDIE